VPILGTPTGRTAAPGHKAERNETGADAMPLSGARVCLKRKKKRRGDGCGTKSSWAGQSRPCPAALIHARRGFKLTRAHGMHFKSSGLSRPPACGQGRPMCSHRIERRGHDIPVGSTCLPFLGARGERCCLELLGSQSGGVPKSPETPSVGPKPCPSRVFGATATGRSTIIDHRLPRLRTLWERQSGWNSGGGGP
jgi:hypothetical protein